MSVAGVYFSEVPRFPSVLFQHHDDQDWLDEEPVEYKSHEPEVSWDDFYDEF